MVHDKSCHTDLNDLWVNDDLMNDLMNLKGKLHQSRLVFSIALYNATDINKNICNTTKYTINTMQETNIQ